MSVYLSSKAKATQSVVSPDCHLSANQEEMMEDADVLSPTEFAKRMLNKDQRKESLRTVKENIKEGLTEIRHEVKDTVKVTGY